MAKLSDPITMLKGVGEVRAKQLAQLNIFTLRDLICHFPRGYEDRTKLVPIEKLEPDVPACFRAMVMNTPRTSHIRKGLDLTKVQVADTTGRLNVTFFNSRFACPLGRQNAVFLPHLGGQYLLRRVAHRQRLLHQPEQRRVGQSRGQGINGQNAPGGHGLGLRRLEHGVRHAVADEIPAHRAVENVLPAIFQLLGGEAAVEKRHVQPPG